VFDEGVELSEDGHDEEAGDCECGHDGAGGPEVGAGEPAAGVESGPDGAVACDFFAECGAGADFFVASPDHDGEECGEAEGVEDGGDGDEVGPVAVGVGSSCVCQCGECECACEPAEGCEGGGSFGDGW